MLDGPLASDIFDSKARTKGVVALLKGHWISTEQDG